MAPRERSAYAAAGVADSGSAGGPRRARHVPQCRNRLINGARAGLACAPGSHRPGRRQQVSAASRPCRVSIPGAAASSVELCQRHRCRDRRLAGKGRKGSGRQPDFGRFYRGATPFELGCFCCCAADPGRAASPRPVALGYPRRTAARGGQYAEATSDYRRHSGQPIRSRWLSWRDFDVNGAGIPDGYGDAVAIFCLPSKIAVDEAIEVVREAAPHD